MAFGQSAAGLLEQRHRMDLPVRTWPAETADQEGSHRAQRQQRGGPDTDLTSAQVTAPWPVKSAPEVPPKHQRSPDKCSNNRHNLEPPYGIEP